MDERAAAEADYAYKARPVDDSPEDGQIDQQQRRCREAIEAISLEISNLEAWLSQALVHYEEADEPCLTSAPARNRAPLAGMLAEYADVAEMQVMRLRRLRARVDL